MAVLELRDVDMQLEDCISQLRRVNQRLLPAACWRAGERIETTTAEDTSAFPNPDTVRSKADGWARSLYRDEQPPPVLGQGTGGVRAEGASGIGWAPNLGCVPAQLWPGGPALTMDDTCCGPAMANPGALVRYNRF